MAPDDAPVERPALGNEFPVGREVVALCQCGRSRMRPPCDGSHKLVCFQASSQAEERGG